MIIVEGPDNSGKSTLIKKLKKDFDLVPGPKFKMNKVDKSKSGIAMLKMAINQHYNDMLEYFTMRPKQLQNWIFDRFYFSELVYGSIYRNKISLSLKAQAAIPIFIKEANPFIIYCRPDTSTIIDNYHEREQYAEVTDVERIVCLYDKLFAEGGLIYTQDKNNFIVYNYERDKYEDVKAKLQQYLEEDLC